MVVCSFIRWHIMSDFCSSLSEAFHVQCLGSLTDWGLQYGNIPILSLHFISWNNFIRRVFHSSTLLLRNATVYTGKPWFFPFLSFQDNSVFLSFPFSVIHKRKPTSEMIKRKIFFFKLWTHGFKHIWWVSDCGSQSLRWPPNDPCLLEFTCLYNCSRVGLCNE